MKKSAHQAFVQALRRQLRPDAGRQAVSPPAHSGGPDSGEHRKAALRQLEEQYDALFAQLERHA